MGAKQSTNYNPTENTENIPRDEKKNIEKITLEEAYESLEDYKQSINNVYCLNKILDEVVEELNEKITENDDNPINSVLLGTLHDDYDKEKATTYCEIFELALTPKDVGNCRMLFSCKKYEEIDGFSLNAIKTANVAEKIDNMTYTNIALLFEQRIIEMSKKIPAYGKLYLHSGFSIWSEGVKNYFNLIRKHPIDKNKWIVISSGINIKNYTKSENVYNLSTFSYEYRMLMENITQVMNANTYLNIIEDSLDDAQIVAENAIKDSEEKTALYNFAQKVYNSAPNDNYAITKVQNAKIEAQNASRYASNAVTNVKAAQYSLTEAETSVATKTTTWEYGEESAYDDLRCIYSGIHPQWNGMLIKDCRLHGSNYNIAEVTFGVMNDITHYYSELFNGQTILTSYRTDHGSHIAIIKIIKHGEDVHFQMKEANLDTLFGTHQQKIPINQAPDMSKVKQENMQSQMQHQNVQTNKSHIFIDPSVYFIGIGTNERIVKYTSQYNTTKSNNIQHVVVKSQTYPNFVNTRIAENSRHIRDENYYYMDQFSSSTMRRESNLYSFSDMVNYSNDASEKYGYEKKYGSDISFEITDKTKMTSEIGNIGMVIDKMDDDGRIYGGLSVKTVPNIEEVNGKEVTKPGNTIMYVSSEGLLHISGIMLGEKVLYVRENEEGDQNLYWGDKKIM
jgi:hypothetical protein